MRELIKNSRVVDIYRIFDRANVEKKKNKLMNNSIHSNPNQAYINNNCLFLILTQYSNMKP